MSKIKALDFAKSVEQNRQSLITHCLENGKSVNVGAPLSNIVAVNNTITAARPDGTYKVEFRDIDGELVAPIQYVRAGESATLPSTNPSFDSDYLEFDYWAVNDDDDLSNVQRDIIALPQYKTKLDETLNERPTYLICYFSSDTTLSPKLYISNQGTTVYVSWGDSSAPEQVTSSTMTHTYSEPGLYVIKIYGTKYTIGSASYGTFQNSGDSRYCLLKAYSGENLFDYHFNANYSLTNAVLNNNTANLTEFGNDYNLQTIVIPTGIEYLASMSYCRSLQYIIIPSSVNRLGNSGPFFECNSLKSLRFPKNFIGTSGFSFQGCGNLETLEIPNSATSLTSSAFNDCFNLKSLILPNSLISIPTEALSYCPTLQTLIIPSSVTQFGNNAFTKCYGLENLILFSDWNFTGLTIKDINLTNDCLIDIANKLKDNTDSTSKSITFSKLKYYTRLNTIYLDADGERVDYGTTGAVSLLEFIQNKNWTVSFTTQT